MSEDKRAVSSIQIGQESQSSVEVGQKADGGYQLRSVKVYGEDMYENFDKISDAHMLFEAFKNGKLERLLQVRRETLARIAKYAAEMPEDDRPDEMTASHEIIDEVE